MGRMDQEAEPHQPVLWFDNKCAICHEPVKEWAVTEDGRVLCERHYLEYLGQQRLF